MINRQVAIAVEIVGISVVCTGISFEIIYKADIYLAMITVGSVIVATGGFLYAKIVKDG